LQPHHIVAGVLLVLAGETLILSLKAAFVNDKWSVLVL
jgi:hypothetical protein